jgi:hypothetical protein
VHFRRAIRQKFSLFKRFSQNCEPVVEERYCSKIEALIAPDESAGFGVAQAFS